MKPRQITNYICSGIFAIAIGGVTAYTVASTWHEFRNIRWVSAIAASVGVIGFEGSQRYLKSRTITQKEIDKAVLEQLKSRLESDNCSPSDRLNLEPVIALYASTVETQSIDQKTTLYQLLS
jgi:hypothetical protein